MFLKLRLPVRVKTFKSGLIVVQDSSASDEVVERNILRFVKSVQNGVTALEVGGRFNWSFGIAMELLYVPLTTPHPTLFWMHLLVYIFGGWLIVDG